MRRRLMTMLALLTAMVGLWAQNEDVGRQILVFRNTGEVNLFYSNELDSITTNDTAQVFHSVDTTIIVPFAELDSVAVGSRNEIVVNKNVRQLKDETDIRWLIRTEGNSIFYRKDTPAGILPKKGERLYYAEACDLLPYGLAGSVASVTMRNEEYEVEIEEVDLAEIFDKLFYTGRIEADEDVNNIKRNLPRKANGENVQHTTRIPTEQTLPFDGIGSLRISGSTILHGDFVIDVRRHYYHAHFRGETSIGAFCELKTRDSETMEREIPNPPIRIPLPIIAGVLHPRLEISAFGEMNAELTFNASMEYKHRFEYVWTRKNGENEFQSITPSGGVSKDAIEANAEILLSGTFFTGVKLKCLMNLPGDRIGAFVQVKGGIYANGEFGLGALRELRNPNPELYAKGEMDVGLQAEIAAGVQHREHFLLFGNTTETIAYRHSFKLAPITLPLFPRYERSRAVAQVDTQEKTEVTIATAVAEPTPTPIETGFELVNPEGEVVDSVFAGIIKSQKEVEVREQFFDSEFVVPDSIKFEELDSFTVRPIFHYAGYTVSAAPVDIIKDPDMQQYTSYQSNGAMAFISSGPFLNIVSQDSTIYTLGSYLPVPPKKRLTDKPFIPIDAGTTITVEKGETLVGTWAGEMDGEQLTLTFEEDGTGSLTPEGESPRPFDYELNAPQTGEILIRFEDGADLILQVQSLNDTTLKVMDKRDDSRTIIIFQRQ